MTKPPEKILVIAAIIALIRAARNFRRQKKISLRDGGFFVWKSDSIRRKVIATSRTFYALIAAA